jgi:type VI secretion system secreted protein Hcp
VNIELKLTLIAVCALTLAIVGNVNDAEAAAYLKFDGIDGESTDKDHKGWIDIESFSQTINRDGDSTGTRSRGAAILGDIVVAKELDKSSPKLAESVLIGNVFPKVEIHLTSSAGATYYAYELTNVMVTSYSISGDADQIPMEEFSLNFEKLVGKSTTDTQTTDDRTLEELKEKSTPEAVLDDTVMEVAPKVPVWVQTTAQFWVDGNVSDREFTDALGFLVKEKIIEVDVEPQLTESDQLVDEEPQVPEWIATTTEWWINGEVPEDQFLEGIKWMIKNNIITGI